MPRVRLTDSLLAKALPGLKPYELNDTVVPGFQCVIYPSGRKTLRYRNQNYKKVLGFFPLHRVHAGRKDCANHYSTHLDEIKRKRRANMRDYMTIDTLVKEYLEFKKGVLAEQTFKDYEYIWKRYGSEPLGSILISKLKDVQVNDLFISLKDTYSHTETLKIVLVSSFKYGKQKGYPVAVLDPGNWVRFKRKQKERYFTGGEMKRLLSLVSCKKQKAVTYGTLPQQMIAVELLLATGCRCLEILELKWWDVFLEEGYVQLWKTKTRKGRLVPLSDRIRALLEEARRYRGDTYVFTSVTDPNKPVFYTTFLTTWHHLMSEGQFNKPDVERLCLHSLRHTFITAANRIGVSPWILKALVGHSNGSCVTGIYIHHNLQELTQAQATIIDALQKGQY